MSDPHWSIKRVDDHRAWDAVREMVGRIVSAGKAAEIVVRKARSKRTSPQNRRMWAMLNDLSEQVLWTVNEKLVALTDEEWKDVMTAALTSEMRIARGINGGMVFLGRRTRDMAVDEIGAVIDLMFVFGNERFVCWTDPPERGVQNDDGKPSADSGAAIDDQGSERGDSGPEGQDQGA